MLLTALLALVAHAPLPARTTQARVVVTLEYEGELGEVGVPDESAFELGVEPRRNNLWLRDPRSSEGRIGAVPLLERDAGRFVWEAAAGADLQLAGLFPERGYVARTIHVPEDGSSVELRVPLAPATSPGALDPLVREHDGSTPLLYAIEAWSADGSVRLSDFLPEIADASPVTVPPGSYVVKVRATVPRGWHGPLDPSQWAPNPLRPIERRAEVRGGETWGDELRFDAAGSVAFRVHLADAEHAAALVALRRAFADRERDAPRGWPGLRRSCDPDVVLGDERLQLLGGTHPGACRVEWLDETGAWIHLETWWRSQDSNCRWGQFLPERDTYLWMPLPAGRRTLRFSAPGCQTVERTLQVENRVVTHLDLTLEPLPR
ncbi:MAG: hypothetical protein H6828_02125 [Planctomycetes bacterium]|nr:hypothetical protein [Planctomycetota bacterium]